MCVSIYTFQYFAFINSGVIKIHLDLFHFTQVKILLQDQFLELELLDQFLELELLDQRARVSELFVGPAHCRCRVLGTFTSLYSARGCVLARALPVQYFYYFVNMIGKNTISLHFTFEFSYYEGS